MIIGILFVVLVVPLTLGVLAGWDTDGFRARHFVLGTTVGLAIVLAVGAILTFSEGLMAYALCVLLLLSVLVLVVRARRGDRSLPPYWRRSDSSDSTRGSGF